MTRSTDHTVRSSDDFSQRTSQDPHESESSPTFSSLHQEFGHKLSPQLKSIGSLEGNTNRNTSRTRSSDSDIQSDDDLLPPAKHKIVAIDTSQNKHFTHRLLPVQSPEFDNVMDQVLFLCCHLSVVTLCAIG